MNKNELFSKTNDILTQNKAPREFFEVFEKAKTGDKTSSAKLSNFFLSQYDQVMAVNDNSVAKLQFSGMLLALGSAWRDQAL